MCASARNVIIPHPTPPHPIPWCCVAATMCASTRKMMLRSTDHVCKCKERYHPPPHPIPWCCVAATMCAGTRKMMLRSTDHVCKCKERYHPPPHPTPPRPMMLRSTDHVCKCKERYHPPPHPTPTPPPPRPTMWIPGKPPVPRVIRLCWDFIVRMRGQRLTCCVFWPRSLSYAFNVFCLQWIHYVRNVWIW